MILALKRNVSLTNVTITIEAKRQPKTEAETQQHATLDGIILSSFNPESSYILPMFAFVQNISKSQDDLVFKQRVRIHALEESPQDLDLSCPIGASGGDGRGFADEGAEPIDDDEDEEYVELDGPVDGLFDGRGGDEDAQGGNADGSVVRYIITLTVDTTPSESEIQSDAEGEGEKSGAGNSSTTSTTESALSQWKVEQVSVSVTHLMRFRVILGAKDLSLGV